MENVLIYSLYNFEWNNLEMYRKTHIFFTFFTALMNAPAQLAIASDFSQARCFVIWSYHIVYIMEEYTYTIHT